MTVLLWLVVIVLVVLVVELEGAVKALEERQAANAAAPTVRATPETITIQLLDEVGQPLGATRITAANRRVNIYAWANDGKLYRFMASHQDGGQWVYRRVK